MLNLSELGSALGRTRILKRGKDGFREKLAQKLRARRAEGTGFRKDHPARGPDPYRRGVPQPDGAHLHGKENSLPGTGVAGEPLCESPGGKRGEAGRPGGPDPAHTDHDRHVRLTSQSSICCPISDYLPFPSNKLLPWLSRTLHWKIGREKGVYEFLPMLGGHPDTPVENAARWEGVAALLYPGGKTGKSKGVMLTHANLSCNVQQLRAWAPDLHDGRESVLAVFPFFRAAGWTGIQNLSIFAGWTDILVPKPEPDVVLEIMGECRPTILPGSPAIYTGLLAHKKFRGTSLSSVKGLIAGSAVLPVEVVTKIRAVKDGPIINLYGLTELSPVGTATPWGGTEKPGTVGVPLPGTDMKIVDAETGTRELPAGETGEICFKGPQVMKGYHKKPRESEAVLRAGWLYTGDIGFLDEDGYLTLVDRQ